MNWLNHNIAALGQIDDFDVLLDEFNEILSPEKIKYKSNQLSLQTAKNWNDDYGPEEWSSVGKPSLLPGEFQHNEELFVKTISILKGTYIEELFEEFDIFKARCAILPPKTCYTWHYDNWPRIHFVIKSNPKCFFLFGNQGKEILEEGQIYFTDTTDPQCHTAINASWHPRIHIFGNVKFFEGRIWNSLTDEEKRFNEEERERDFKGL